MQPKVSIIIPCYNKALYIGNTFDSIIAQTWDNIELIIVNDGSTDGTREVISEYEPKFIARGFEVVIFDQENQGVSAAVHEGFLRFSGDFVCQVDADDELDQEYVRVLAGWLWEHPDYDWVVCDILITSKTRRGYSALFSSELSDELILTDLATGFLLRQIRDTVHEFMVRTDYVRQSGLIENFYRSRLGTQESQFILTLAVAGGKLKYIPKPLYRYRHSEHMMSLIKTYDDIVKYFEPYYENVRNTILGLRINQATKSRYLAFMEITKYRMIYSYAYKHGIYDDSKKSALDERLLELLKDAFPHSDVWSNELLSDYELLYTAIKDNVYDVSAFEPCGNYDRIIAWGVMGVYRKAILPYLKDTLIEPTELWDIAGDGALVKKPHLTGLTEKDLVLVMLSEIFGKEIYTNLAESKCDLLSVDKIWTYLSSVKLPQFYDGSIKI